MARKLCLAGEGIKDGVELWRPSCAVLTLGGDTAEPEDSWNEWDGEPESQQPWQTQALELCLVPPSLACLLWSASNGLCLLPLSFLKLNGIQLPAPCVFPVCSRLSPFHY